MGEWALALILFGGGATTGWFAHPVTPPEIVTVIEEVEVVKQVTVEVPIPVMPKVPVELTAPLAGVVAPLPTFIGPHAPGASSCLDVQGEDSLKRLISAALRRQKSWEAWSSPVGAQQ
ncbi:MAG: hypothetical protein COX57_04410 [Alphaproteobacteria bacterium CG_4_10_14_0_2_um_filter_63_37]|nr:MAG: hypothetical protein AUJ55_08040 [Proteobacteria bacterium CG1_02_64_396]PJA25284.1 MAG: hypothetical protein COX57_04410 [Alphaproteobacteria bacterium CG_4_10_14_0_2_um_filter_63_37]